MDPKVAERPHIAHCFERADEFDLIHNGFDFLPLTYSELVQTPVLTTIHGFSSERILFAGIVQNQAYFDELIAPRVDGERVGLLTRSRSPHQVREDVLVRATRRLPAAVGADEPEAPFSARTLNFA